MRARDVDPVTWPPRRGHPPRQPEYQEARAKRLAVRHQPSWRRIRCVSSRSGPRPASSAWH